MKGVPGWVPTYALARSPVSSNGTLVWPDTSISLGHRTLKLIMFPVYNASRMLALGPVTALGRKFVLLYSSL